jgi:hypothetical protein
MATPMTTADFRSEVLPFIVDIYDGMYKSQPEQYPKLFETVSNPTQRSEHLEPVMYGFGNFRQKPEGTTFVYDKGGEQFVSRYVYVEYGLAFAVTRALRDDVEELYPVVTRNSKHLAFSKRNTKETIAADIFNRAFNSSYAGGDGVSLLNANHPLVTPTANGASVYSNTATAASLSEASIEQLGIQISKATDARGKYVDISEDLLIVPPDLKYQAERLTKSVLRTGTGNNDVSALVSMGMFPKGWMEVTRLSSTTAWFIKTNAPEGLKYLPRADDEPVSEGDFETDNLRVRGYFRCAFGWTNPQGLYGNQGV